MADTDALLAALAEVPELSASAAPSSLSPCELEVLRLVVDRQTARQIAYELFISRRTVTTHVQNIFNKLGMDNRAGAAALAVREGLA
ncbi:MAG: LuxR C-terminal-related transcriptional regulator [Thermomicrobiales bacterium]